MPLPRLALLTVLLALACPAPASAGVTVVTRDVPLAGAASARAEASGIRVLPARRAPVRFNLAGVHWRGSGEVWFRTARVGGAWSAWRPARPETEDGPNTGSPEARARAGWKLGNPYWTGTARRFQLRLSGRVTRVRAHYVWSPVGAAPPARTTAAAPTKPPLVSRAVWGANEQIVRGTPSFASRLAFAVVHHTAGAKPSSAAQSAAIVRGIHSYHVLSNGWNDIGYNFLVDPFGQIFVGRKGGAKRNVIGAHAQGFNTGSVGVAVLGTYESGAISAKAREALTAILAWRLDLAHVDPTSRLTWTSGGNPKFPAGTPVSLAAVSGHRDTGATSCPGARLHKELGSLASAIRARGGAKIFAPRSGGALGGPVRFTARLSEARAWTVDVRDSGGRVVASGSGTGTAVDWTWDSAGAPAGRYTYRIAAGTGVRAATGVVGGSTRPLALTALAARPLVATPNGDGVGDAQKVTVTVTTSALLDVRLETPDGAPVATVVAARALAPGTTTVAWKGRAADGTRVEDGRYVLVAEATAGAEHASRRIPVRVDRTLARLTVMPTPFSPNGDGRRDTVAISFDLRRDATVHARVVAGSRAVATLRSGPLAAGRTVVRWNGRNAGTAVADGRLSVVVDATTSLGTRRLKSKLVLDTTRPRARILAARRVRGGTLLRVRLSERAKIAVRLGGRLVRRTARSGTNELRLPIRTAALTVYSFDFAGNAGRRVSKRVRG